METRLAALSDAGVLAELHCDGFGKQCWSHAQILQSLSLSTTWAMLALRRGEPVGFIMLQVLADEAELLTLCVCSAQRCQGIGGLLLHDALAYLERLRIGRLYLEVASDNSSAHSLYRKAEFREINRRTGYYRRPTGAVDALIMERLLS